VKTVNISKERRVARKKRQSRVRNKITGSVERPRLCVFRTSKHIYAQIIEDVTGNTLVTASTVTKGSGDSVKYSGNVEAAKVIGKQIAEKALAKDIKQVVFDRNGFLYHGRVKALADAAREAGLTF
jgi:large subunit ribosomal protein L18